MYFYLFVLSGVIIAVKCGCYESYMTFCDDLSDIHSEHIETWREVVIGSIDKAQNQYEIDFNTIELARFTKLKTLIVIGQVRDIASNTFYIDEEETRLETVNFYGNDIRRLKFNTFDTMRLRQLTFRKNNLEYIQQDAFYQCQIDSIDLSDNRLEQIESGIFSDSFLTNSTRELILKNNRIASIGTQSLPIRLEILNLNNNKLVYLVFNLFHNMTHLAELYLNHNQLKSAPEINTLKTLQIVDLSYNKIGYVGFENFNNLTLLEVLDFSHNQLIYPSILKDFHVPKRGLPLQVSFAFNLFTSIVLANTTWVDHIFIFYGNPWNCLCWEQMEKYITDNGVRRHKCDLEFFGTGQTPYCLYYDNNKEFSCNNTIVKKTQFTAKELANFLNVIKDDEKNIVCNLTPIKL